MSHPLRIETPLGVEPVKDAADRETIHSDTVVIAIDGSTQAEQAFTWYVENLHRKDNRVILVHGVELNGMPTRYWYEQQMELGSKRRTDLQEKFLTLFNDHGIYGKFVSELEIPGQLIVEVAEREAATYIVMGTRGLGKLRRTIMGSVSDYVVHHSHCPIVVARG